jgi:hypothetical protein
VYVQWDIALSVFGCGTVNKHSIKSDKCLFIVTSSAKIQCSDLGKHSEAITKSYIMLNVGVMGISQDFDQVWFSLVQ